MNTKEDIAWAAGFLEGEGYFGRQGKNCWRVSASQVYREPLEKLQSIFGGGVCPNSKEADRTKRGLETKDSWMWYVSGEDAILVMFTVFSYMSNRRKEQILKAISNLGKS